jgi:hypothetical protein
MSQTVEERAKEIVEDIAKTAMDVRASIDPTGALGAAGSSVAMIQAIAMVIARREATYVARIEALEAKGWLAAPARVEP